MDKQVRDLLIISGIIGGGLGLYYLLDKNIFHVGSSPNMSPVFLSPEAAQGTMPVNMQSNVSAFTTSTSSPSYSSTHIVPTEYNTGVSQFVMGFDITQAINNANNSLLPPSIYSGCKWQTPAVVPAALTDSSYNPTVSDYNLPAPSAYRFAIEINYTKRT